MVPCGIGLACVPMSNRPPALTLMLPLTIMNSLSPVREKDRVPLIVVVLAVAVLVSTVTVVPAAIVTVLQETGTKPRFQVEGLDQLPFVMLI